MLCWVQEEWIVEAVDQKTKKIEVRKTEGLLQVLLDFVTKRLQSATPVKIFIVLYLHRVSGITGKDLQI